MTVKDFRKIKQSVVIWF